jgi:parallel beta-helix repeat protein
MAKNTILAKNKFLRMIPSSQNPFGWEYDRVGIIFIFRCENTYLLNNSLGPSTKGGITLLFSKNNFIKGNSVFDCRYGLSLFYGSDNNEIKNNLTSDNRVNIIIEDSHNNIIQKNNFIDGRILQGYDSGKNTWRENFWNDWTGTGPYNIPPKGRDPEPVLQKISIANFKPPVLEPDPSVYIRENSRSISIADHTKWENKEIPFEWFRLSIEAGGKLTIENSTVTGASNWIDEPLIEVKSGGELHISRSKILANPPESYLAILVQNGGKITILNSELRDLGASYGGENGVFIISDQAVITNSLFKNNLASIYLGGGTAGHVIKNNIISTGFFGIFSEGSTPNTKIENNRVKKIADDFLSKLIPFD